MQHHDATICPVLIEFSSILTCSLSRSVTPRAIFSRLAAPTQMSHSLLQLKPESDYAAPFGKLDEVGSKSPQIESL